MADADVRWRQRFDHFERALQMLERGVDRARQQPLKELGACCASTVLGGCCASTVLDEQPQQHPLAADTGLGVVVIEELAQFTGIQSS